MQILRPSFFVFTLIFSVFLTSFSFTQFEYMNNWYFGQGAGLEFSTGTAVSVGGSTMIAIEGSTSYSDMNGDLLFYTNGVRVLSDTCAVWDKNHQIMPNGILTDITGYSTSMQSSIVIPKPGTIDQYYLFCLDGTENYYTGNYKGLTYSIVDMSLNGGSGDLTIKGVQMNVPASPFLTEQLTATKHANGLDYWLIVHENNHINQNTNEFFVYQITSAGIFPIASQFIGTPSSPGMQSTMQISAQGNRLAFNGEVFDFDNSTGLISNPVLFASWGFMEFSRSGRFLYKVKANYGIYQYDLESPGIPGIEIASSSIADFAQIQLGPDGKMYISHGFNSGYQPYLSVINNPDQLGALCNFVSSQVTLNYGFCDDGLPNFIDFAPIDDSGINEQQTEYKYTLYPVPTNGVLNVKLSSGLENGNQTIHIKNSLGQIVLQKQIQSNHESLDVSFLDSGIYFMKIGNHEEKFILK